MDDLIASLSSSHIGQEACELAALQAQLAQSLGMLNGSPTSSKHYSASNPTVQSNGWSDVLIDDGRRVRGLTKVPRHNVSRDQSTHRNTQSDSFSWPQSYQEEAREEGDRQLPTEDGFYDARGVWQPSSPPTMSHHYARQPPLSPISSRFGQSPYHQQYDSRAEDLAYAAVDPFFAAQLAALQQQQQQSLSSGHYAFQPQQASGFN